MDLKLKDKVALITGGTNGLGLRTARAFAGEGCNVSACSLDSDNRPPSASVCWDWMHSPG